MSGIFDSFFKGAASQGGDEKKQSSGAPVPPPLSDLTDASERQAQETQRMFFGSGEAVRRQLEEGSAGIDRATELLLGVSLPKVPGSDRSPETPDPSRGRAPGAPEPVRLSSKPVRPADPVLPLLSADEAIVRQCLQLLRNGQVEDFNKLRPAGRLDLRGINLAGADLRNVDFRHVDLTRSVLSGANLEGAKLQHASLDRADLSESQLSNAELYRTSLRYADLRRVKEAKGAQFHEAVLRGAELNDGNFSGTHFTDAVLITASLVGAKFIGANMERVHLGGAVLSNASFERANLHRAKLFQSNGENVNFSEANLTDAEARQAFYRSTGQKQGEGNELRTSFRGAWIHGFVRDSSISTELLDGAISSGLPPEGLFPTSPDPKDEKILVDGIPGTDKVLYDAAMEELDELIGLKGVKSYIRNLMSLLKASQARDQYGLPELDYTLHRAYTGSPGTGKTTVARIFSKLLFSLGCLEKGHLIETDKTGLIAGYAGQTLEKTSTLIDSALGGTLLIDEAYALTQNKDDSYAKDAIAVLTKRLEDDRAKFCCVVCGYTNEMKEFLNANPGLADRFDDFVEFPDYSSGELVDIMKMRLDKKRYQVTREFLAAGALLLEALHEIKGDHFANGRSVRKTVEQMGVVLASRLEREGKLRDREALLNPGVDDLPFKSMLGFGREHLPEITELRWVSAEGKELKVSQLPLEDEFPVLTDGSRALIKNAVERARAVAENAVKARRT